VSDHPDAALEVTVFKSHKRANTYVYLPSGSDYAGLPEALQKQMGKVSECFVFELTDSRTLAQADPVTVRRALLEQGFYLQLPPNPV